MIKQGFYIGDEEWWLMCYYDVWGVDDLREITGVLISAGDTDERIEHALDVLSEKDSGYAYTNFSLRTTVLVTSRTTSAEELFDSILHEIKHATENIGEYYDIDPKSEASAYLQGEIGRNMFRAVAMLLCPKCNKTNHYEGDD